jgi:CrcB protein
MRIILVLVGGALGALARYGLGGLITRLTGFGFPYETFIINISGSFALGMLAVFTAERALLAPEWRTFLGIGFLGAYTTFSTWQYETWRLIEDGNLVAGLVNIGGSVVVGFAAVLLGIMVARAL